MAGGAALGLGGGLIGGMLIEDAIQDHDQEEYQQGYGKTDIFIIRETTLTPSKMQVKTMVAAMVETSAAMMAAEISNRNLMLIHTGRLFPFCYPR